METQALVVKWIAVRVINRIVLCSSLAPGTDFVHFILHLFTFYSSHEIEKTMVNSGAR